MSSPVRTIEDALAEALRYRIAGTDIVTDPDGTRHACIYNYGRASEHGGYAIAAKINLTGLAIDIERALS